MHTCFVLEKLYRTYRVLGDPAILSAVDRGYRFYRRRLFYSDGRPRPFSEGEPSRFKIVELYDHAEALKLALLLRDDFETDDLLASISAQLLELQTTSGYFVTRVSTWGIRNRVPYHRWAQAQAFCAMAQYYEYLTMSN
jgi:hypothetical protein